jgi:hypothetical protein
MPERLGKSKAPTPLIHRVWAPVRRTGAQGFLLLTLLSFAATVGATRLFLTLTGYPQLAGGTLHIAHVLWGGLFLFLASLLMLIYVNRWIFQLGAVLAGVGVGLFIDEVGKFITAANDYFFPAAAPIVYAFFLLTVLVYQQVRRRRPMDARQELYSAFEEFEGLLDGDLEPGERRALVLRLRRAAQRAETRDLARLARSLSQFAADPSLKLIPERRGRLENWLRRVRRWEAESFQRPRFRAALAGVLAALGLLAWKGPAGLLLGAGARITAGYIGRRVEAIAGSPLFLSRLSLELLAGVLLLGAAVLLLAQREREAITVSSVGLLVMLTVVNLLVFYYEQFSTIITASLQFLALLAVLRYRQRFLAAEAGGIPP